MSERIPLPHADDDGLGETTQSLLSGMRDAGVDFNVIRALANHPALLEGFMAFSSAAYWGSSVDPATRELAYLTASLENDCHY
jgi:alkylhydroperoxidase family enzyme